MATHKNAIIRYQALDKCFRNPGRKYFIEDLIEECNYALHDIDPSSSGVKRRQVYEDIKFMKDSRGFDAPIEEYREGKRIWRRYSDVDFSIGKQPLNEQEAQQLQESLMTLSRFKGLPQFEWVDEMSARLEQSFNLKTEEKVLSFDENLDLKGLNYIGEIYNAIVNKISLSICYKPYYKEQNTNIYHPYYLKQYNNRWFLWALNNESQQLQNLALDRINSLETSIEKYKINEIIDFEEFFEEVVGVSIPSDEKVQRVILQINTKLWPYIETKPLHRTQTKKHKLCTSEFIVIQLSVKLNYELEALILSYGEDVLVLEPQVLVDKISKRVRMLNQNYF